MNVNKLNIFKNSLIILSFLLFLTLLPLALKVDFLQNDDWYYYKQVARVKNFDFSLDKYVAPTLYLQSIIGALFSTIFSSKMLPVLTLIFSVLNFYLLSLILKRNYLKSTLLSALISLLFFVNPLHGYSIWGFMTENYFLFFVLLGVHTFLESERKDLSQLKANLIFLLSFFVRQLGMVFYPASTLYFLVKTKYKKALTQFLWFLSVYFFYQYIFPKTYIMKIKTLEFNHLINFDYSFAVIYGSLLYAVAIAFPLVLYLILKFIYKNRSKYVKLTTFFLVALIIFVSFNNFFQPEKVSRGEFPYFENTFQRTGFYPSDLHGTKYQFMGIFDFYYYLDLFSKFLLAGFFSVLVFNFKYLFRKRTVFFLFFICVYLMVEVLAYEFLDRYLTPFILIFFLFIVSLLEHLESNKKVLLSLLVPYLLVFTFLFYSFTMDFILTESYVWKKSNELVAKGVSANRILSTSAWNEKNERLRDVKYLFSYDTFEVNSELRQNYELYDSYIPNYPLNIHISPGLYLYEIKDIDTTIYEL